MTAVGTDETTGAEGDFTDETPLPPFPPEGADLPSGTSQADDGGIALDAQEGVQNLPFTFCFYVNARFWGQLQVYAPDPGSAATTANQVAYLYQVVLQRLYPSASIAVTATPC